MKSEDNEQDPQQTVSEVNLKEEFQLSGVGDILSELDNDLIGLEPVKTRIK
ncbi:MAG: CbbX protein, partial [Rhodobacteraceae bacterium]|nr:CbbX protein [Paracoccaceae bacterium]